MTFGSGLILIQEELTKVKVLFFAVFNYQDIFTATIFPLVLKFETTRSEMGNKF